MPCVSRSRPLYAADWRYKAHNPAAAQFNRFFVKRLMGERYPTRSRGALHKESSALLSIPFDNNVTMFVGENGSGKSTLLEAIAYQCGFNLQGGGRNANFSTHNEDVPLAKMLVLSWLPKITRGFFLRAESFFDYASYVDAMQSEDPRALDPYGGVSLHEQSHGESFFALFKNRFGTRSFLLLDEPEAALSPRRQLDFLGVLHELANKKECQILMATHSPILLGYPGAAIWTMDSTPMRRIRWEDTKHYMLMRRFLLERDDVLEEILEDLEE